MEYQVNIETCWIAGLWAADRGSLAKGVLSINNSNTTLIDMFIEASLKNFDITESKIRRRIIKGYGISNEAYFTRLPARKFVENIVKTRLELSRENAMAFLGGRQRFRRHVYFNEATSCTYFTSAVGDGPDPDS